MRAHAHRPRLRSLRGLVSSGVCALGAACAAAPANEPPPGLSAARYVLLGEVHDNPAHHALRAALLEGLMADGRPTTVVFEQIDRGHDTAIGAAAAQPGSPAARVEAVVAAAGLNREAWAWPLHRPLFEVALRREARIVGGNLGRDEARPIVRGGLEAVPADLRAALVAMPWLPAQQSAMEQEIHDGHCGALPAAMLAPMALAQRARDAALASAARAAPAGHRVVLIAGNGHVRRDLGVPAHLQAAGVPAADIVSMVYLEDDGEAMPADRVVRTPAAARADPCASFKAPR